MVGKVTDGSSISFRKFDYRPRDISENPFECSIQHQNDETPESACITVLETEHAVLQMSCCFRISYGRMKWSQKERIGCSSSSEPWHISPSLTPHLMWASNTTRLKCFYYKVLFQNLVRCIIIETELCLMHLTKNISYMKFTEDPTHSRSDRG